jgi:predicted nuclease of restriction endonuclease-like RecB superfamily
MYDGVRSDASANLSIAGPYALFERTTAYGNRLFDFCKSLILLRSTEWTATVDVMTQSADGTAQLAAIPLHASMRRYFVKEVGGPTVNTTRSGDEEAFRRYFEKLATGWSLNYEGALVPIDDPNTPAHRFMVPDFVARHEASDKEVLIEIVGYWRPEYLQRKLGKIMALRNRAIILLVNRKLLLGQHEAAELKEAGVHVLYYEGREQLKDAAREVAQILQGGAGSLAADSPESASAEEGRNNN